MKWVGRGREEIKALIKGACLLIFRMNGESSKSGDLCGLQCAAWRIEGCDKSCPPLGVETEVLPVGECLCGLRKSAFEYELTDRLCAAAAACSVLFAPGVRRKSSFSDRVVDVMSLKSSDRNDSTKCQTMS